MMTYARQVRQELVAVPCFTQEGLHEEFGCADHERLCQATEGEVAFAAPKKVCRQASAET